MAAGHDLHVRGGLVLAPDGTLAEADVLVEAGTISAVGPVEPRRDIPVLDATGSIVVPGLVNAHMHSGENLNPGRYENLPLDLWFVHSHEVTRHEPPPRDVIYVRTLLGAIQALRNGTTAVGDFVYEAPEITLETLEPVVAAYRDAGLRTTVLLGVADRHFLDSLPLTTQERAHAGASEAPPPSPARALELARGAVERWHEPGGLLRIGLGPSAPQRCSAELLQGTFELACELDLVWHIHVLETKTQRYTAELAGQSFVELLESRGFLGPRTAVVHAIWLTDADIEMLARTGTTMIHCLLSNLRLGDGVARLPALRDAGVRIALGTDGRGCDETLDMLELTKMTALVHKARGDHFERWPTAAEVLEMATVAGGEALRHATGAGRIEPGAAGDLVLLLRRSLPFTPLLHPVRQLVYGAASREVRTVVVGGRVVLEHGALPGIDLDGVLERAERYASPLSAREADARSNAVEEAIASMYERAEAADVAVDGYIRAGERIAGNTTRSEVRKA